MRQLLCLAFFAASSLPVFAATPTEVVSAYHAAVAHGETAKALSLLSPTVQIFESGHVEQSKDEYAGHHLPADIAFAKGASRKVLKGNEHIAGDLAVVALSPEPDLQLSPRVVGVLDPPRDHREEQLARLGSEVAAMLLDVVEVGAEQLGELLEDGPEKILLRLEDVVEGRERSAGHLRDPSGRRSVHSLVSDDGHGCVDELLTSDFGRDVRHRAP